MGEPEVLVFWTVIHAMLECRNARNPAPEITKFGGHLLDLSRGCPCLVFEHHDMAYRLVGLRAEGSHKRGRNAENCQKRHERPHVSSSGPDYANTCERAAAHIVSDPPVGWPSLELNFEHNRRGRHGHSDRSRTAHSGADS